MLCELAENSIAERAEITEEELTQQAGETSYLLIMSKSGVVPPAARSVRRGNGLETWGLLCKRVELSAATGGVAMIQDVMALRFAAGEFIAEFGGRQFEIPA